MKGGTLALCLRFLNKIITSLLLVVLLLSTVMVSSISTAAAGPYQDSVAPDDIDSAIQNGRFYPQAGPGGGAGFSVIDDDGAAILSAYKQLGGVDILGYPVSRRYTQGGFTYQAFQRGILQFGSDGKAAHLVNVFDYFNSLDRDSWLDAVYGVPHHVGQTSANTYAQDRTLRLDWLTNDAIKKFYYANPNPKAIPVWSSPDFYGLPTSKPEERGPFIVQRFQRIAIQVWTKTLPGMPPAGSVTMVLGGDLAKTAGLIPTSAMLAEPAPRLLAPPAQNTSSIVQALAPVYLSTARENIIRVAGNRPLIIPGGVYRDATYVRDSFYAVSGLNDPDVSKSAYQWFLGSQNAKTGQISSALPLDAGNASIVPKDDESTLLMMIWAYTLMQSGVLTDTTGLPEMLSFVQSHVYSGYYVSQSGAFRYWADNYVVRDNPAFPNGGDSIAYNQGLYVVALEAARMMKVPGVTTAMVNEAKAAYRSFYRADLGHITLSKGTTDQDLSALLPEFLYRQIFRRAVLPDDVVESTVRHAIDTGLVRYPDGSIAGIKTIAATDGKFLPAGTWAISDLAAGGNYQNGGYWPRDGLIALSMLYRITKDPQVRSLIEKLVNVELSSDGTPKEYLTLQPGNMGRSQTGRTGYSWNAIVVPAFKFAGLIP